MLAPYKVKMHNNPVVRETANAAGDPPAFSSDDEPQDQFVFEVDAEGRPVTLTFTCPVSGSGPPTITWSADDTPHTYIQRLTRQTDTLSLSLIH